MSNFEFPHTRTYDSDLGWLIKCCKNVKSAIQALEQWKADVQPQIDDILTIWNAIESGDLPIAVTNAIQKWLYKNAIDLMGDLVKHVFFGLTDDGHFVAYIPDSWDDITFNTTYYDIILEAHPEVGYGHLILSY